MQVDANDEPGSINGGNQTLGKWTESSRQSPVSRDKDCDHVDETGTLYNRTRRPDWDEIKTQEKQRTTWGRVGGWGSGRVAREGGREWMRGTDMISGTCGQEVGVYYDASEMYAARVGAAGSAEANRGPGGRRDEAKQRGDEDGE